MKVLVTGAAGFIGSHLVDSLLDLGHDVLGVDCFTPYYDPALKRTNLKGALRHPSFDLLEVDLRSADLTGLLQGCDVVFHQAGQPGVRLSWSSGFSEYESINVLGTQKLLEAAKAAKIRRLVYASSSSVYGDAARFPTVETDLPSPMSPYGVTKLAGEHLCNLYASNWGVPTVSLRYFTVYGPRQRPDMAIHRLIGSALGGPPFPLYGDGSHVRDFTYVGDVVRANLAAADADVPPGTVVNVAGGGSIAIAGLIELVAEVAQRSPTVERRPAQPGDVQRTGGSVLRAEELLHWAPLVALSDGLATQVRWASAEQTPPDLTSRSETTA